MAISKGSNKTDITITTVLEVANGKEVKKTQKFTKIRTDATADKVAAVANSIVGLLVIAADTVPVIGKEDNYVLLQG
ncbi:MAG: DUF1659 domain-containing protein [Sarcina sp.]